MNNKPKIAIVGGGPGGLTTAVILFKNGFSVRVYESEKSKLDRSQGGSLDLHEHEGQMALKDAGLLDKFRSIARHQDQESKDIDYITGTANENTEQETESIDRPEIDRGVLRDLLLNELPEEVVIWNSRLQEIEVSQDGPHRLIFGDQSIEMADVVIGADGAWSRVRRSVAKSEPKYTGVTFLEGWIETPAASESKLVGRGTMFSFGGPEAIFAQLNGNGRICVYAGVKRPLDWAKHEFSKAGSKKTVNDVYREWAPNLKALLQACSDFVPRPIWALDPESLYESANGVVLIGDAAHVMPPMGTGVNLAMLDGADVAKALVDSKDWKKSLSQIQLIINGRAEPLMRKTQAGFSMWFSAK